jgi:hypothetical protein
VRVVGKRGTNTSETQHDLCVYVGGERNTVMVSVGLTGTVRKYG